MAINAPKNSVNMQTVTVSTPDEGDTWFVTIEGELRFFGWNSPIAKTKDGTSPGLETVINGVITELNDAGDDFVVAHGG